MSAPVIGSTLSSRSLTALAPLLLALACSAGGGDSEGPPAFAGSLGGASTSSNANTNTNSTTGTNTPAAPNGSGQTAASSSNNGAGGSSSSNEGQNGNIGIAPAQNQNQNQSQSSAAGAGGAPATSTSPGASAGAAGQTMMPPAMGASGSASMPPTGGQMPPTTPANADCPTQFFCDGFENVPPGAGSAPATPLWQVIDSYTPMPKSDNVQISTMNAHGGKQAVRISSTGSRTGIQAALPQNTFFMRAWLQVDAAPRGPVLIGLGTDQSAETRLRIFNQSWATINAVPGNDGVEPDGARSGNCPDCVTLVPNRWFCAEMGVDSNAKTATLWIDGTQAATFPNIPSQPDKPNMFIGNMALEGGQTGVWIDDVVAGPSRIGCN